MIYIKSSIESEKEEEFDVVSITLMRRTDKVNSLGEFEYTYGGWWKDRDGNINYVNGAIYNDRNNSILNLMVKILLDAETKKVK